jgi:hypothetical protein
MSISLGIGSWISLYTSFLHDLLYLEYRLLVPARGEVGGGAVDEGPLALRVIVQVQVLYCVLLQDRVMISCSNRGEVGGGAVDEGPLALRVVVQV